MGLFLFNPEQMLIGKLSKRMYKPFHINDKVIIEKNLNNIIGAKLLYTDYVDEKGVILCDTIGITKDNTLCLVGYKKTLKDDFLKRYEKQYDNLVTHKDIFESHVKARVRKEDISMYRIKAVFISNAYTKEELRRVKEFPIPCELYTWSLVENIIIFQKAFSTFK